MATDPDRRNWAIDWSQTGQPNGSIAAIRIEAIAGGLGFAGAAQVDGAEVLAWDAAYGAWRPLGANDAPRDTPAELVAEATSISTVQRYFDSDGRLYLRVQPRQGLGSGTDLGALSLDDISVAVRYRKN
jgi:hypothetical protein